MSINSSRGHFVIESDYDAHALLGSGFDIEIGSRILPECLDDKRADLSRNRPDDMCGQATAVISNYDLIPVDTFTQTFERNDAVPATAEGMFERVCDELVYNKSHRERDVDGNRGVVQLEVKSDPIDPVRIHHGPRDLT